MHQWQWQTHQDLPYLTCDLLADWDHGFFTHHFAPRSPFEITEQVYPSAQAYRLMQVHGKIVLAPSELTQPINNQNLTDGDGLFSQAPNQAVWVCSADCTPALIADTVTGHVAAVHAGWRGTAARIIPEAIDRLVAQGSAIANLRVAMGPAISGEVYQVDRAVALETLASITDETGDRAIDKYLGLDQPPILPDEQAGKLRLDVRRVNGIQLAQLGFRPEQVAIAPHCTYQDPENFFSYRREPIKRAQWSGIVSRG
jgi:polyphenol oxidase